MEPIKAVMKITIENGGQTIFETDGRNTLAPLDRDERSRVFYALTEALASVAGVTPQHPFSATEDDAYQYSEASEQYRQVQTPENVVHLAERRGNQAASSKNE